MLLDLDALKARLGIPASDTSQDATITVLAQQAQALAETYCDRAFDYGPDDETFPGVYSSFQVHRYPIETITEVSIGTAFDQPVAGGAPVMTRRVDAAKGLVWPFAYPSVWVRDWLGPGWPVLRCQYTGGFQTAPIDLGWALTQIFDTLWASTPGAGLPPGQVGAGAFDVVKKISVVGAYSVEMGSTGDASHGAGGGDNTWGILSPGITAVLDGYTRAAAIGIG
jgi:hypothetical protein